MATARALWISRHPLDGGAKDTARRSFLRRFERVEWEEKEILFPPQPAHCAQLLEKLMQGFDLIAGVFPAQAIEALNFHLPLGERRCRWVIAPISVPSRTKDASKVRSFKFYDWALLWRGF